MHCSPGHPPGLLPLLGCGGGATPCEGQQRDRPAYGQTGDQAPPSRFLVHGGG